jgi:N-acetylmuramoyl-L-alanine amidase
MIFYNLFKINSIILLFSICCATLNAHTFAKKSYFIDENKRNIVSEKVNFFLNNLSPLDSTYRIRKVVIDAGHGGKDSGCIGYSKKQEKDITLKIALAVGAKIKAEFPNIKVIYTRDEDVFIPLDERANIANRNRADLFISIHCNFLPGHSAYHGSETYVLGLHKTKENLEVARRENAAIILEDNYDKNYNGYKWDTPEANIIINAWQASYLDRSMKLASEVEKNLAKTARRKSIGVKQAGFLVLRATTMPSILIETGFLSNPEEERFLNSREGQDDESDAIFKAFCTYKKSVETNQGAYEPIIEDTSPVVEKPKEDVVATKEAVKVKFTPKGGGIIKNKNKITYKVQLITAPTKINTQNDSKWDKIKDVEIRKENNLFKYLAIGFDSYEDALLAAREYHNFGFNGAFVVAYEGETRIEVKEAMQKQK